MAPKLQDTDLFVPVKVDNHHKFAQPVIRTPSTASPCSDMSATTAKATAPDSSTKDPIRKLRHKRRFTIGGAGQRSGTNPISPVLCAEQKTVAQNDIVHARPAVTISRTSSSRRDIQHASPAKDVFDPRIPGEGKQLQPDITNVDRLSPTPTPIVITDSPSSRSSRSRSPKALYPPSSWKRVEPLTFNLAEPAKLETPLISPSSDNTTASPRRPGSGKARHTEPVSSGTPTPDIWTEIAGLSPPSILRTTSSARSSPPNDSITATQPVARNETNVVNKKSISGQQVQTVPEATRAQAIPTAQNTGPRYIRSRRRSNPVTPSFSEHKLPAPEIAYADTFHYTNCEHTSPPMSRPLNTQPILVPYQHDLLAFPPFHIREFLASQPSATPSIYIIEGACSICDLAYRRKAESDILARYTTRSENLLLQLSLLQEDLDVKSPTTLDPPERKHTATPFPSSSSAKRNAIDPEPPSTTTITPENIQAILQMEEQAENLIKQRDLEVRAIWRGYTERWGPATVAIHHANDNDTNSRYRGRARAQSASSAATFPEMDNISSLTSNVDNSTDRTSTMTSTISTRTTQTSHTNNTVSSSMTPRRTTMSRRTSRSSSIGQQDRYSDGTRLVSVSSSVDGVKKDGRMMVDWIRPERTESALRIRSHSQSQTRDTTRRGCP
ncbi:uncharacterized protein PV06_03668 [Exophiala oligosperma]|uniref:Uncharacterized protein n=1 Tax=Exophiala oligosperma TaxID=215243 RepID=A0A0D2EB93_9EURO|nr:uncharacterized protein PV06_03668 [Exophiala oligosperma]KIW45269.1 hypothetical protein PV06_03668 [Exophiala oligosperma]